MRGIMHGALKQGDRPMLLALLVSCWAVSSRQDEAAAMETHCTASPRIS